MPWRAFRLVASRSSALLGNTSLDDDALGGWGSKGRGRQHLQRFHLRSHVTALEPVDCLKANKRTQLTALQSSLQPAPERDTCFTSNTVERTWNTYASQGHNYGLALRHLQYKGL